MKNFKTAIEGTGTMYAPGRINYLRTMLGGEYLQEIYELLSLVSGTTNACLKFIKKVLLGYLPSFNALSK